MHTIQTITKRPAGLLLRVPKFSKYLHGVASLYPTKIEAFPYWFLPADKDGYRMTPASWDEMADPQDPYLKVELHPVQICQHLTCLSWQ